MTPRDEERRDSVYGRGMADNEKQALQSWWLGLSAEQVLVVPRVLGLMVVLPLLVFVGNVASMVGAMLVADVMLDITPSTFIDRLREALFNILVHAYGNPILGARVLDLFAGTGALGIEAISRGARFACFVEDSAKGRALLRENVDVFGLGGVTKIFRRDATQLGQAHPNEPFDLVFCDPPYRKGMADKALTSARVGGWLVPGAIVVVEEAVNAKFAAPEGFEELERRAYDETEFVILRAA